MHPPHSQGIFSDPDLIRTTAWIFGECNAIRYKIGTNRADDWIRTSMIPLTRRTPFSVEPRRRIANASLGFEPTSS